MTPLAQSIYRTLAFFDAQDMALTLMEMKIYLVKAEASEAGLSEIRETFGSELPGLVNYRDGFYFLAGRQELVNLRKERYKISLLRMRKAKKYLYFLRFMPYLRAVAISGSAALGNSSEDSDIDLFVITKKNRVWLARLLLAVYFQIFGQRRHGNFVKGRFCLNHYLAEGKTIAEDRNLYTAVEYGSLIPIVGHACLEKFWQENEWIGQYLSDFHNLITPLAPLTLRGGKGELLPKLIEFILELTLLAPVLNYLAGIYQKRRIQMQEHILVSDGELSFHPGSRGQRVLEKFHRLTTPVFSANNIVQKN